jgi:YD repeat-containing protein
MVAIFTGAGTGFERGSGSVLGSAGLLGSSTLGRGGDQVFLNAATGNLMISDQDEFLVGLGPDVSVSRTYNSLGDLSDENADNWRQSTQRRIINQTGTLNSAGSTVQRVASDGSVISYTWDATKAAYVATDGAGAYDTLTTSGGIWTWKDGDSQISETYEVEYGSSTSWRIVRQTDSDSNALTFSYVASSNKLDKVTTQDGSWIQYNWSGNNITQIVTGYSPGEDTDRVNRIYRMYDAAFDRVPDGLGLKGWTQYLRSAGSPRQFADAIYNSGEYAARGVNAMTNDQYVDFLYQSVLRRTADAGGRAAYINALNSGAYTRSQALLEFADGAEHVQLMGTISGRTFSGTLTLSRTRYGYDGSNRLSTVTVDLSPEDGSVADGKSYTTTYTYKDTTSRLVTAISQSDGSRIDVSYDGSGRVSAISETVSSGVTRTSSLSYGAGYTTVTDGLGQVVQLSYDSAGNLTSTTNFTNQLYNSQFQGVSGWAVDYNPNGIAGAAYSGIWQSKTLVKTDVNATAASQYLSLGTDDAHWVAVTAGQQLFVQTGVELADAVGSAQLVVHFLDANGNYISAATIGSVTGNQSYNTKISGFVTAPANAAKARLEVYAQSSGSGFGSLSLTEPVLAVASQKVQFAYDGSGNLTSVTDALGNITTYSNFVGGLATTITDALGNVTTRSYGSKNELLSETTTASDASSSAAAHTVRYVYDGEDHLRFRISAEGDVTEYRYTAAGLVSTTVEYAGAKYSGTAFDESSVAAWAAGLDPTVQVKRTETQYDVRGNAVATMDYAELYNNRLYNPQFAGLTGWFTGYNPNNIVAAGSPYVGTSAGMPFIKEDVNASASGQVASICVDNDHLTNVYPGETLFAQVGVGTAGSIGTAQLVVHFYDANGSYLSGISVGVLSGTLAYNSKIAGNVPVPTGAVRARLEVYGYTSAAGAGSLTLTAPILESRTGYADLGGNRAQNSCFEEGTAGWWVWQQQTNMAQGSLAVGTDAATGKRYLQQTFRAANTSDVIGFVSSDYWPVDWQVAGGERLAVAAGVGGTAGSFGLSAQFFDENGNWVTEIPIAGLSGSQPFNSRISGFVQAPAGAKVMRLVCYATASVANTNQTVTFTDPYVARASADQTVVPAFTPGIPNKSPALGGSRSATYSRTSLVYDQAGKLLARQTDGRNVESFVYDGMGRLTSAVDVNCGTTTYVFNDVSTTTTVTLASGRVQTSTYNKAGELISFAETGAGTLLAPVTGTATYGYDQDGRLRWEVDATGRKTYHLYDGANRKVADVGAGGQLVEYKYDAGNRVIATVTYGTVLTSAQLAYLDNQNSPADIASYRPAAQSSDLWTWHVYDKEGRVLQTITGDGSTSVNSYDGSGRLIRTTDYYNKLDSGTLAGFKSALPGVVTPPTANSSKDRVARNFYDKDGLLVGQLDGNGFLRQIKYDGARQKIEDRYFAQPPSSSLWATGTFAQLVASTPVTAADRVTYFTYDGKGQLRFVTDANGNVTQTDYDQAGQATCVTQYAAPIAATSDYGYANIKALLLAANIPSNSQNRRSWTVYDSAGRAAYAIDGNGAVSSYAYNSAGQVTKQTQFSEIRATPSLPDKVTMDSWGSARTGDPANRTTRYYYDGAGVLRYTVDAEGYVTRRSEDAEGRLTSTERFANVLNVIDSTTIDTLHSWVAASAGASATATNSYDPLGRLATVTDGESNVTRYVYNANGTVQSQTAADGTADASTTYFVYDGAARVLEQHRAYGTAEESVTRYSYDGLGNTLTVTDPDNHVTSFTYEKNGNLSTRTDAAGITSYYHDAFGNVIQEVDRLDRSTYNYYDAMDRLIRTRDAEDYITATAYNAFGEVVAVTRQFNRTTSTASVGVWPTATADSRDATTSFQYDNLGRVVVATDAEGYYEQYTLNAFGNRTSVRNKLGGVTTNTYDRRGLLLSETLPMSSIRSEGTTQATSVTNKFSYDARGNRTQMIEAYGLTEQRTTNYAYDKNDRLISKSGDALWALNADHWNSTWVTPTETYAYDKRGNLIQVTDANGAKTFSYYDHLNRKIAELNAVGNLTYYTYDPAGNLTYQTVYDGWVTLPSAPGGNPPPPVNASWYRQTGFGYDALNRRLATTQVAVLVGTYSSANNGVSTATQNVTSWLAYDANGNVITSTDANGNISYSWYDKLGRKTAQLDGEGYLTSWTFDDEGNALSERRYATKWTGAVSTSTPPAVAQDTANDRVTTFTYDRNGHRLTETRTGVVAWTVSSTNGALTQASTNSVVTYTYNGLGQVTSKTEATGDQTSYAYDQTGRLTQETRAGFTDYASAAAAPVVEYDYDGLNDLSRTRQGQSTASGSDRITMYNYSTGGRLYQMRDAAGNWRDYYYDAAGNRMRESWTRIKSDGSTTVEGHLYNRDLLGRVTSEWIATAGSGWVDGDHQNSVYNAYGEVYARGINGTQEYLYYNNRGLLEKTNTGDGVWRFFVYDGQGNQVLAIESAGKDYSSSSISNALADVGTYGTSYTSGVNATISVYNKRGQVVQVRQPQRETSAIGSALTTIVNSTTYNAFGEAASQTDALNNVTTFTYNVMGRLIQKVMPQVSVTSTAGVASNTNPTECYYYDLSGRLVGSADADGFSTDYLTTKANATTRSLLAGTGYNGSDALVTAEYHRDGGIKKTAYDVFGDARTLTDELNRNETHSYDGMGRVLAIVRRTGLQETFTYDLLGQQIKHQLKDTASTVLATDTTDYDLQGRVTISVDGAGDQTTYAYAWDGTVATALGTTGGFTKTTTQWAQLGSGLWKQKTETTDVHGLTTREVDFGGNVTNYTYDRAGRLTQKQGTSGAIVTTLTNSFFNTGLVATVADSTTGMTANTITSTYAYDAMGRRTKEKYYANTLYKSLSDASYTSLSSLANQTLQDATMTYDGLGRLRTFSSTSATGTVTVNQEYDAAGNIRRTQTTYPNLVTGGTTSTDYWFTYDTMNRMVIANGALVASVIKTEDIAGALNLAYDVVGNRKTATTKYTDVVDLGDGTGRTKTVHFSNYETYYYDADNQLNQVDWHSSDGNFTTTLSTTTRDIRGRVTEYVEYASGAPSGISNHRYNIVYNARGQVSSENDFQWVSGGTDIPSAITNTYDNYGNLTYQRSVNTNGLKDTWQSWTIAWHAQADIGGSTFDRDYYGSNNNYTSTQYYDGLGRLQRAFIADGKPRAVHYALNADGQVISSVQNDGTSNDPRAYHLFANGVQIAEYTSDANEDLKNYDYQSLVATKFSNASGSGRFYHGATTGTSGAETGTSGYDPVNALTAGTSQNSRSRYTVQSGDTLQGIAASLWGDSSLWYLIADANGLSADSALTAGQGLAIPLKGPSNSNNASMFRPYDTSSAVGDLNPTSAKPPKHNKCGAFGQILLAAIAIAVTAALTGPLAGAVGSFLAGGGTVAAGSAAAIGGGIIGGALAGAAGSIVSQGFGVATGLQQGFSWKGVALAALSGAVGGGMGAVGKLGTTAAAGLKAGQSLTTFGKFANFIGSSGFLSGVARGVATSAISQGVGVVTGLQDKFDWAGVAAAGIGSGVTSAIGVDPISHLNRSIGAYLSNVGAGMASDIADAATRSVIDGSDFGDNLLAALPDIIGQTIGGIIADGVSGRRSDEDTQKSDVEPSNVAADESDEYGNANVFSLDGDNVSYFDTPEGAFIGLAGLAGAGAMASDPWADIKARVAAGLALDPGYSAAIKGYDYVTPEQLVAGLGIDLKTATERAPYLNDSMYETGIDSPSEQSAYLAQTSVETGGYEKIDDESYYYSKKQALKLFPSLNKNPQLVSKLWTTNRLLAPSQFEEFTNYIFDDANRHYPFLLGNTQKGDGWTFHGRGYIQATGRESYGLITKVSGIDFLSNPALVNDPRYAARAGAAYFVGLHLDRAAQAGKISQISQRVASDSSSWARRSTAYYNMLKILTPKTK